MLAAVSPAMVFAPPLLAAVAAAAVLAGVAVADTVRARRRFLELVSSYVGYRFRHQDWQAIQAGLDAVTSDHDTFSYPLTGQQALTLTISKDLGRDDVSVQATGRQDRLLGARIAALTDAFQ